MDSTLEHVVSNYLKDDQCFSIALDIASTRGTKNSYLGIVASFFDHHDHLRRVALDLRNLTSRHNARSIRTETKDALRKLGLSFDNIVVTVTDGARNMKAVFR